MKQPDVFDLDALFGAHDPIKVRYQNKVYELRRMDALSIDDLMRWQKIQDGFRAAIAAPKSKGKSDKAQAVVSAAFEQLVRDSIQMICPEMIADKVPLLVLLAALKHYNEKTRRPGASKKAVPPTQRGGRTGRKSSRA